MSMNMNMKPDDKPINDPVLLAQLNMIGLGEILGQRVIEHFRLGREELTKELNLDPYILMRVDGIGFTKADKIACSVFGVKENDPRRQKALILKMMDDAATFGHTFLPGSKLKDDLRKFKILDYETCLTDLVRQRLLIVDDNRIYSHRMYWAETGVANAIKERIPK